MRIIEPSQFQYNRAKKKRLAKAWHTYLLITLLLIGLGLSFWSYLLPVPNVSVTGLNITTQAQKVNLPWPKYGQSAIGATGFGVLAQSGINKPVPIASLAKLMVAQAILNQHPLAVGQEGPIITVTQQDEAIYDSYLAKNGSVIEVAAGERISEYQALEAMLLPSANNIADMLANWGFGSIDSYTTYANNLALKLGLSQTHLADASGFSKDTVATASDLVLLGQEVLKNPVISQIVKQKSANISIIGKVTNTNHLLTHKEVVGIKTGNTDEAGGCYLFAARHKTGGKDLTVIGAVLGAPTLGDAMADSLQLLTASYQGFDSVKVITSGQAVGYLTPKWGKKVPILAKEDLSTLGWKGSAQTANVSLRPLTKTVLSGGEVGTVSSGGNQVAAIASATIKPPGLRWRLLRWL